MPSNSITLMVVLTATGAAALWDARTGRIPNALTLPTLVLGVGHACWTQGAAAGLVSVLGLVAAAAVPYWLFSRGAMGGGDVKLLAGLGAWLGVGPGLEVEWLALVVVALQALVVLAWRGRLLLTLRASLRLLGSGFRRGATVAASPSEAPETIRMGVGIFLATLLCRVLEPLLARGVAW